MITNDDPEGWIFLSYPHTNKTGGMMVCFGQKVEGSVSMHDVLLFGLKILILQKIIMLTFVST